MYCHLNIGVIPRRREDRMPSFFWLHIISSFAIAFPSTIGFVLAYTSNFCLVLNFLVCVFFILKKNDIDLSQK